MDIAGTGGKNFNVTELKESDKSEEIELKKACQDFESIFINFMFKSMRKTVPEGGLIKKGQGEKMYRDMMDMELSSQLSKGDGFGLSESLYRQLKRDIDIKN